MSARRLEKFFTVFVVAEPPAALLTKKWFSVSPRISKSKAPFSGIK